MAMMSIADALETPKHGSLKITETKEGFLKKVGGALAAILNKTILRHRNSVTYKVRQFVETQIRIQPEVRELTNSSGPGSLNAMLGITPAEGTTAVNEIIREIVNSVKIQIKKFDSNLDGGVDLIFANVDMGNIASLSSGQKDTLSGRLPWLRWMLMQGGSPIIIGFRYMADTQGRTGGGIMIRGGVFRVPLEFAGTEENNFITRALVGSEQRDEISRIFQEILK